MHKIVFDANVWIKYARSKDIYPLTARLDIYAIQAYANNYLLSEIFDALTVNKWMTNKAAKRLIDFIADICEASAELAIYRLSPDGEDNYLFDIAIQNNCECIITDDSVILELPLKPVPVYSSGWFLKHFPL